MAPKKPFPLRLDPDLYEALRKLAAAELRSVNGQIEYLLRQALEARGIGPRKGKPKGAA